MKNLLVITLLLGSFNAFSQTLSLNSGETYAVVVGISDYQDEQIPDLRFADKDAEAFANFLRSRAGGELDEDHLKVLINEQATQAQFAAALDWLWEVAQENDKAIIYFSGHGDVERKSLRQPGYLLCWDAPSRVYMAGGAFPLSMLQEVISTVSIQNKAKVIMVADACRAGKLSGSSVAGAQLTNSNLAKQYANEIKILSCQPDEYSVEGEQWGGGRGAFSFHLLDGLYGMADGNEDLSVNLLEISRYLEDNVSTEVAPHSQIPMTVGSRGEKLAIVFPEILAELRAGRKGQMQMFAGTESKSMEDDILEHADTSIIEMYLAFKQSLDDNRFFEPQNACTDYYYGILSQEPTLEGLHSSMRRNYAAALQDDAQQTIKTIMEADSMELVRFSRKDDKYRLYPISLKRAAELLGEDHYMYNTLMARLRYFEGLNLRLYYNIYQNDSLLTAAIEKQKQSLALQDSAAHVYYEMAFLHSWTELDKYLKKAIELAPAWILPNIRLYTIYNRTYRRSEAYELLKNLLGRNPICSDIELSKLYTRFGGAARNLGKYEEAEQAFLKAMEINPENAAPVNALSLLYETLGRYEESEALWDKYLSLRTFYQFSIVRAASAKYNMGKIEEAIQIYKKGVETKQGNYHLRGRFSWVLHEAGYEKEALDAVETNFQMASANITSYFPPAEIFVKAGLYEEAIKLFKFLRDRLPNYGFPHIYLIEYSLLQGNIKTAREGARKAVELHPDDPGIKLIQGKTAYKNKEFERFDSLCSEIAESVPNDAELPYDMGVWYKSHGNFDLAEKYLKLALTRNRLNVYSYSQISELYYSFGKCREALQSLEEGLTALPNHRLLKQDRAVMTYLCDSAEKAKPLFLKEEAEHPGFIKIWEFLEAVRLENYEVAVKHWREIHTVFRTDYLLPLYLDALIKTGDLKAAIKALKLTNFKTLNYQLLQTASVPDTLRQHSEYKIYLRRNYPELFDSPLPDSLLQEVKEHPYQAYNHRFFGYFHHRKKRYPEAEQSFLKSLEIEPENPYAKIFLTDIYMSEERYEEAAAMLPDSFHSEKVMANFYAGKVYYQLNKKTLAEKYFKRFAEMFNSGGSWHRVAKFYKNHGETALAETYFRNAVKLRPDKMNYLENLAILYFFSGQRDSAFQSIDENIKSEPGQVSSLALRAFLHYFENPEEAEPYFREVNALLPDFISLWNTLELMRKNQFVSGEAAYLNAKKQFGDWWMVFPKYAFFKMKTQQRKYDTAIDVLEELLKKGILGDYHLFRTDNSLDPIRTNERYKALMKRFFPEKRNF